jgi:hypothetical protein
MPDNVDKALNMAIVATTAEKEEKAIGRDDRGSSTKVFAVGGSRESIPENRSDNSYDRPYPRGRYQWSSDRGGRSQNHFGQPQYSMGVDGTYSDRTDDRTSVGNNRGLARDTEGKRGGISGPKNGDDRYAPRRPRDIICYNCGLKGHIKRNCPGGQRGI